MEILPSLQKIVFLVLKKEGAMSPEGVLFGAKYTKVMDSFVYGNDGSSLEVATSMVVKARDPLMCIKRKLSSVLNLEIGKQAGTLATIEVKAPSMAVQKRLPS